MTDTWQPKTYDELDTFCLFHYKKPFHSLGISYEVAVKNILKLQIEYMEKTIENLSIEMDTKDE